MDKPKHPKKKAKPNRETNEKWRSGQKKSIDLEVDGNGCFNCISHVYDNFGYCHVIVKGKRWVMHRFVYEQCFGEIPKGMVIRHKCDNPHCINPEHLEIGTLSDNTQDMIKRNRHKAAKPGIYNHNSRFTKDQVIGIYKRVTNGDTITSLSKEFGVSVSVIHNIKTKRKYKSILGEL